MGFWLASTYLFHKENVCGPFFIFACGAEVRVGVRL